jgi:ABC-type polar amino acid transport system ATPase subunit
MEHQLAKRNKKINYSSWKKQGHPIEVKHVQKHFGENEVLRDINLQIRRGEVIGIIGPSRYAKCTFLRSLNLLKTPTAGSILLKEQTSPRPK